MEKVQREKWVYQSIYTSIEKEQEYALSGKQLVDLVQFENYLILDTLLASVYWKDLEGKILGCNRYVLDMFGYADRADFIGKKNEEFLPAAIAHKVSEHDQKVIASGQILVIEEQAKMVHFEKIQTFITTKTPLTDKEGKIIGLIGVSINITEQKEAQEKENLKIKQKELEEKKQLVIAQENHWAAALAMSSLAHDLKNHLQPLGFSMELIENFSLEEPKIAQKIKKYVQIHRDNLQKTYFFIDQINKQQQSRLKGEKYVFSKYLIAAIVRNVVHFYADLGWSIEVALADNFYFWGDELWVYKILHNLISNAQGQISQKGKGKIFIQTQNQSDFHVLQIIDTAGGLTLAEIETIFERYKTGNVQGTGIGLAAVQMWMQQMKGKITAELVQEDCIQFSLYFPKIIEK